MWSKCTEQLYQGFWCTINALSFWSLPLGGERQEQHTTTYHYYIDMLIFNDILYISHFQSQNRNR